GAVIQRLSEGRRVAHGPQGAARLTLEAAHARGHGQRVGERLAVSQRPRVVDPGRKVGAVERAAREDRKQASGEPTRACGGKVDVAVAASVEEGRVVLAYLVEARQDVVVSVEYGQRL